MVATVSSRVQYARSHDPDYVAALTVWKYA